MKPVNFARSEYGKELAVLCLDMGYRLADRASELTRHQINFLLASLARRREIQNISSRMARFGEGGTTFIFED